MKVIDLLNKIANGEEVPKKFIVNGDTLCIGEDKSIEYANGKKIEWFIYPSWLNEEVEILEEENKIPEKFKINYEIDEEAINEVKATMLECDLACKINEIIDYLDYLKSKGDE